MTDEAGFLAQLDANPDDDTTRLVYADWLEERGDPRAAFLRLDLEVAARPADQELEDTLRSVREPLDAAWVARVEKPYDFILDRYADDAKMWTIMLIRELLCEGLYMAKGIAEAVPNCLGAGISRARAEGWRDRFRGRYGPPADVEMKPSSFTQPIYAVVVTGYKKEFKQGEAERLALEKQ